MSVINTNVLSLITQNNLKSSQAGLSSAISRLSSGLRITSAKDDAAGQAIANRFTSNIRGLNQASRNANDGISMAQTAEGALNEVNNNLQRIRELAVQAANGTNTASDLSSLQAEVTARLAEIDRLATKTQFNSTNLLDATAGAGADGLVAIQVGANDGDTIILDLSSAKSDSTTLGVDSIDLTALGGSELTTIDGAIALVDEGRSNLGATQNQFTSAIASIGATVTNLTSSRSAIEDADYATEVSNMTRAQILQQAGTSVLAKANQSTQGVMALLQ